MQPQTQNQPTVAQDSITTPSISMPEVNMNTSPIESPVTPTPKKKSNLFLWILIFITVVVAIIASYYVYTQVIKVDSTKNNTNNNNQNTNTDNTNNNVDPFVTKLKSTVTNGGEYMFFVYDNEKDTNLDLTMSIFDLVGKKKAINNAFSVPDSEFEFLDAKSAVLDETNGDVYFATGEITKDAGMGDICDSMVEFPSTSKCKVTVYKGNMLNKDVTKLYEQEGVFIWTLDSKNSRLIISTLNTKDNQVEYKSISLVDKNVKTLARITGISEEFALNSSGKLNLKGNSVYEVVSKFSPDVYTQKKYVRIIDLETGKWTEELIPSTVSTAISKVSLSQDLSKVLVVYDINETGTEDMTLYVSVYDVEKSKLLTSKPKLVSSVANMYAFVSNNGDVYLNADDDYMYSYNVNTKISTKMVKGANPNQILNNQKYLVYSVGSSTNEKVNIYDISGKVYFSLTDYYTDFFSTGTGQNQNGFWISTVK